MIFWLLVKLMNFHFLEASFFSALLHLTHNASTVLCCSPCKRLKEYLLSRWLIFYQW